VLSREEREGPWFASDGLCVLPKQRAKKHYLRDHNQFSSSSLERESDDDDERGAKLPRPKLPRGEGNGERVEPTGETANLLDDEAVSRVSSL